MKLEATKLNSGKWAVRPEGRVGMMGWIDGKPWEVSFVRAATREEAIKKVTAAGDFKHFGVK